MSHLARAPTILYGVVLLYAALAYYVLQGRIVARAGGSGSDVARALGRDWKGRLSPAFYLLAILFAFVDTTLSAALYVAVALLWLVPDRRLAPTSEWPPAGAVPCGRGSLSPAARTPP